MFLRNDRLQCAIFSQRRIPGHLASREGSARDAGQKGSIPGCPGQSGTGGNPDSLHLHLHLRLHLHLHLQLHLHLH